VFPVLWGRTGTLVCANVAEKGGLESKNVISEATSGPPKSLGFLSEMAVGAKTPKKNRGGSPPHN